MAIFNSSGRSAKIFQAGKAKASIAGVPAMLTQVTVQIGRSLQPVPTLTDGVVWSAQPAQGTLQAGSIITSTEGKGLIDTMTAGDACTPLGINVTFSGACDAGDVNINIVDGYCTQLSFTAQGGQGYIANDVTINFTNCTVG